MFVVLSNSYESLQGKISSNINYNVQIKSSYNYFPICTSKLRYQVYFTSRNENYPITIPSNVKRFQFSEAKEEPNEENEDEHQDEHQNEHQDDDEEQESKEEKDEEEEVELKENDDVGVNKVEEFDELLLKWGLEQYVDYFERQKCTDVAQWGSLQLSDLTEMKIGHSRRFVRLVKVMFVKNSN